MKPDKKRRKELRRLAEHAAAHKEYRSLLITDNLAVNSLSEILSKGLNANGVDANVSFDPSPGPTWRVANPGDSVQHVELALVELTHAEVEQISAFEMLTEHPPRIAEGMSVLELKCKVALSPVHDLLFTAVLKVLGPRLNGLLVHFESRVLMDDWVSWSLDYMGPKITDVRRVYDENCPNFADVLKANAQLVFKKPWWKLWER